MDTPKRSRVERSKRIPVWLSECQESNASAAFQESESEEEVPRDETPVASPKKRRSSIQRLPASAWRFNADPDFGLEKGFAPTPGAAVPTGATNEELALQQEGAEGDEASAHDDESSSEVSAASLAPSMILELPRDLLARILNCLPINILLQASGVCKAFAEASETLFETQCQIKKWKPPRRPRGDQAEIRLFPWRSLFRRHACQGCGKGGEFPVRVDFSGALAFLVCRRCAMNNRERLACESLYIDLVGISGKRLITNNKKNRFCYRRSHTVTQVQQG